MQWQETMERMLGVSIYPLLLRDPPILCYAFMWKKYLTKSGGLFHMIYGTQQGRNSMYARKTI